MMPVTHALVGIWAGQVFNRTKLSSKINLSKRTVVSLFAIGAVIPDIDFISKLFGRQYYDNTINNIFLSHRGVTHSILGVGVLSLICAGVYILSKKIFKRKSGQINWRYIFLMFFSGGLTHLLCDLPSPATVWTGIPVFFPFRWDGGWHRVRCLSFIGWYDYVVLYGVLLIVLLNAGFTKIKFPLSARLKTRVFHSVNSLILIFLIVHIVTARYDSTVDYYLAEAKWRGLQLNRLPDFLVNGSDFFRTKMGFFLFYKLPHLL